MASLLSLKEQLDAEVAKDIADSAKRRACEMQHALLPPKANEAKIAGELKQQQRENEAKCREGLTFFLEVLPIIAKEEAEHVEVDLLSCLAKIGSIEAAKRLGQEALDGKEWKELLGIQEETLLRLYQAGKFLLDAKRPQDAAMLFFFCSHLTAAIPTTGSLWDMPNLLRAIFLRRQHAMKRLLMLIPHGMSPSTLPRKAIKSTETILVPLLRWQKRCRFANFHRLPRLS